MSSQTTRITIEELRRDLEDLLDRVVDRGDQVEIEWHGARVTLVRHAPRQASGNEPVAEDRVWPRVARTMAELPPVTPEVIARRRAALEMARKLRSEIAAAHPVVVFDAVADIRAAREERDRQLEQP